MLRQLLIILFSILASASLMLSQTVDDSLLVVNKYPLCIGNLGFATDSMEIVVGNVPRGEITNFSFELFNFGETPIIFTNGKSNHFITLDFEPDVLLPKSKGKIMIEFDADAELDLGNFVAEVSIVSNDSKNPYKFINLIMYIIEGAGNKENRAMLDTIPSIVFDHYIYDYGHFVRGRRDLHNYLLTNNGGVPLIIDSIVVPKGIKVVEQPELIVYPGEETVLGVKINTHGRVGVQHQTILVYSNDPHNSLIILGVHGSVRVFPSHKKTSIQCNPERRY